MKTRYLVVALIVLAGFNWLIGAAGIVAAVLVNFNHLDLDNLIFLQVIRDFLDKAGRHL